MPLVRIIKDKKSEAIIGIWEITESAEALHSLIELSDSEIIKYNGFTAERRKEQWLASRIVLQQISENHKNSIVYDEKGRPFPFDKTAYLSISHTANYVSVILCEKYPVGIDIEKIHPRILKIRNKFISKEENEFLLSGDETIENLMIIWSAKEALFKVFGQGNLDFRKHLKIKPFSFQENGTLYAWIKKDNYSKKYKLQYIKINDHILVYLIDFI